MELEMEADLDTDGADSRELSRPNLAPPYANWLKFIVREVSRDSWAVVN